MIGVQSFFPVVDGAVKPFAMKLSRQGWTSEKLLRMSILASSVAGLLLLSFGSWPVFLFLLPLAVFFRFVVESAIRILKREGEKQGREARVLSIAGGSLCEVLLFLPLALLDDYGFSAPWIVLILIFGLLADLLTIVDHADPAPKGPMGSDERAFVFGVVGLLLGLNLSGGVWLFLLQIAVFGLVLFTALNRYKDLLPVANVVAEPATETEPGTEEA